MGSCHAGHPGPWRPADALTRDRVRPTWHGNSDARHLSSQHIGSVMVRVGDPERLRKTTRAAR